MPAHLETTGEPEPAEPDAMADADDDSATELEAEGEPEDAIVAPHFLSKRPVQSFPVSDQRHASLRSSPPLNSSAYTWA